MIHTVITARFIVLSVLLLLCTAQAISHRRWALSLDSFSMAANVSVMQFVH